MRRIKAAVVGLGHWGPTLARNLDASPDYELVASCDIEPGRGSYTSLEAMLRAASPELVAIATPASTHHDVGIRALSGGAHVFCEKPLATTLAEAEDLVALARRRGLRLFVNHMCANARPIQRLRERYAAGELGDLVAVEAVRAGPGRIQPDVDVVWDLVPHDLSIIDEVLGRSAVESVRAVGGREEATIHAALAGGASASIEVSWRSSVTRRRVVFRGTRDVAGIESADPEALARELSEVARALHGSAGGAAKARVASGEDGLSAIRVLEACRASFERGGARVVVAGAGAGAGAAL